jgi:hypothetical protein
MLFEWTTNDGQHSVQALRAALRDYRHLSPLLIEWVSPPGRTLDDLERDVAHVWQTYQDSRYARLAATLPRLLNETVAAGRAFDGDAGRRAQKLVAYTHHVATLFLTKLGESDLAWTAASRGLEAATLSEDPVVVGSLSRAVAHASTANGDYADARAVGVATLRYLSPLLANATPDLLSVFGTLHLMCGLAAARDDDRSGAREHLQIAAAHAAKLGRDANHVWTAFGPTNVLVHETCIALEFGDVQRAVRLGEGLDTGGLPTERQVRHAIEVARALQRLNRVDECVEALLAAERVSAEQVRYHRLSRVLVRDVIKRAKPPRSALELGYRMGLMKEELGVH